MDTIIKKEIRLDGLCCANCAAKIERQTAKLDGVQSAAVDVVLQKLTLTYEGESRFPALLDAITQITAQIEPDVQVSPASGQQRMPVAAEHEPLPKYIRIGIGTALFIAGLAVEWGQWAELVLFLAGYLLIGGEVVLRAAKNVSKGQVFDEHFLMTVATIGAFAIGEYPEGAAVMLFYQVGEAFQDYAVGRSRRSIAALMDIRPDFANIKIGADIRRVAPEDVRVGDLIIVKPGERIPLDGVVTEGRSALDTSALTGESLPRDVAPGAEVLSGSINTSGLLTIEVQKPFGESTVSKILDLVQNASASKAPVENFITRFARYYTPAVVFAAAALAVVPSLMFGGLWSEWVHRALVFLVVSCPCALVISIPLSFFGGIGGASRNGILVKGSNYLDALYHVDTVVFDKTGTLTSGMLTLAPDCLDAETLRLAASVERYSSHPVAKAVCAAYQGALADVSDFSETAGMGVGGWVDGKHVEITRGSVYIDGTLRGSIDVRDEVKPDSKRAVAALKALGVNKTVMLTGDSRAVGEKIGRELGLDQVFAELLPQHKVEQLEKLLAKKPAGGTLLFVGDGINDAPVLARADVGIAMGGVGSDAAIEAADVVLMTDEPSKIADAIQIAKKTRGIVMQNIVFALAVKGVILLLGAMGLATMWAAVFGDVGVALIAVLNAMRAMKFERNVGALPPPHTL